MAGVTKQLTDGLMGIGWPELTFDPDGEAVAEMRESWGWLLAEPWRPLLFSVLGDAFIEQQQNGIFWLNSGTGELTWVAENIDEFQAALKTELAKDWFMPDFVALLHAAGKIPSLGQCYSYSIFPVFANGKYEVDNLNVVPAREHFGISGCLHFQIAGLADGQKVQIKIVPGN